MLPPKRVIREVRLDMMGSVQRRDPRDLMTEDRSGEAHGCSAHCRCDFMSEDSSGKARG